MARTPFDDVWRDVRLACRALRATPVVTAVAVTSLALGIGANTAIFSVINSLLLRTLPVRDPGSLVLITDNSTHVRVWSYAVWIQIGQRPELFERSAAWSFTRFNLASGGETQFVDGLWQAARSSTHSAFLRWWAERSRKSTTGSVGALTVPSS